MINKMKSCQATTRPLNVKCEVYCELVNSEIETHPWSLIPTTISDHLVLRLRNRMCDAHKRNRFHLQIRTPVCFSTISSAISHAKAHHHFSRRPSTKCENTFFDSILAPCETCFVISCMRSHDSDTNVYDIPFQVVIVESQSQSGSDDAKQALTQAIQMSRKLIPTIERTSAPRCSMSAAVSSYRTSSISSAIFVSHSIHRGA